MRELADLATAERIAKKIQDGKPVFECGALWAIAETVSDAFRIPISEILGPTRAQRTTMARWIVEWLARQLTDWSFPALGRYFGRHHTTVVYGGQRVDEGIKEKNQLGFWADALLPVARTRARECDVCLPICLKNHAGSSETGISADAA